MYVSFVVVINNVDFVGREFLKGKFEVVIFEFVVVCFIVYDDVIKVIGDVENFKFFFLLFC